MTALRAQVRAEMQILRRNGEQLLLTLVIPVGLLVFFSLVDVLPSGDPTVFADAVDFLTPGIVALAVMSSAMVSLGIATGFERSYHVLKRLGVTPLGRPRWLAAKILTVLAVQVVQLLVLLGVALLLGWRPESARWLLAVAAVAVGTTAFAGVGLTLAGRLRAEINLALQNALFLLLLLLGGMVIPFEELPGPLADAARLLPSGALADVMRDALVGGADRPGTSWIVLGSWAVVAPAIAAISFRWD
ncbi:MAG: ABC transporter permease [Ilumatobacteraceae bacterium]